jgi:subtilase family serine protease
MKSRISILAALALCLSLTANAQLHNPDGLALDSGFSQSPAAAETAAHAALPYPNAETPKAIDLGELKAQSGATPISVTVALRLPKLDEAEKLLISLHTPGDPQFHQFLTADQFVARFAPTNADVAKVIAALAKYGLTAERTTATTLRVTGLPADMERAFSVSLHSYEVPAHGNVTGYTYHAPLTRPTIPAEIAAAVVAVVGLDSRPSFRPAHRVAPQRLSRAQSTLPLATPDAPGYWTVTDFADYYDVDPLYKRGVSGSGRTIGIITPASFTPSDAFAYWSALGLKVNKNRIQIVNVDGGPGAPSDASGSEETTLDVEQSGGVAPGANIIVYQMGNTNDGGIDTFAAAVDANLAETLSFSWCTWEWFDNLENAPVTDPITGQTVGFAQALHELLVRAAIQGQTFFAASADGGAYTVNWNMGCFGPYSPSQPYSCTQPLSVDYPASDPAMTAAGGTTLAGIQEYCLNLGCNPPPPPYYIIDIPHERVWGWDYFDGLCAELGLNLIACGAFPYGSGGGVSIMFEEPFYQIGLPGIQLSQPGQIYEAGEAIAAENGVSGAYYALPAYYPGRNVPDVSFNADPETGYVIYYTSEPSGVFGIGSYWGGTSFVAPQLNGVSALLGEYLHGRIGLLNYPLYDLARTGQAYGGSGAPLHAIAYGDNWFYYGSNGYNPAAGLGTLDVWNFAEALSRH